MQGRVTPENWTHGSAEARMSWFNQGYETGDINQCNTFGVDRVVTTSQHAEQRSTLGGAIRPGLARCR